MSYLQIYLVPLTSGAVYRSAVMALDGDAGQAAAIRAAELAGASTAWGEVAGLPRYNDAEGPGLSLLLQPERAPEAAKIGHDTAGAIAAPWGSYMTSGDPGAVFYSFPNNGTAPDWTAAARLDALAHCDSCIAQARGSSTILDRSCTCPNCGIDWDGKEDDAAPGDACPQCEDDLPDLLNLRQYIIATATPEEAGGPVYSVDALDWLKSDAIDDGKRLRAFSVVVTRDATESQALTVFSHGPEEAEEAARGIAEARDDCWTLDDGNSHESYTNGAEREPFKAAWRDAYRAAGGQAPTWNGKGGKV